MTKTLRIGLFLVVVLIVSCKPVDLAQIPETPTQLVQQTQRTIQTSTPSKNNDITPTSTLSSLLPDPTAELSSTIIIPQPQDEPTTSNRIVTPPSILITATSLPTIAPIDFTGPLIAGFSDKVLVYDVGNNSYHELGNQTLQPVAWSSDGCFLLFKGSNLKLYNTNIRNFDPILVIGDKSWKNPVWSPTGNWIAYDDNDKGIRITKPDGSGLTEILVNESENYLLGWTEDGSEIIVWSEIENSSNILAINIETKQSRILADLEFLDDLKYSQPDAELAVIPGPWLLAPDSSSILLPLRDIQGLHNIELLGILDFQSNTFQKLYEGTIINFGTDWSNNSESLAFAARNFDGNSAALSRTYVMKINTGSMHLLETPVFNNGGDDRPSWGPDDSMLAIQGWSQPYILTIDNSNVILLDEKFFQDSPLVWSPRVVYEPDDCLQK